jgi:hypothetical protein
VCPAGNGMEPGVSENLGVTEMWGGLRAVGRVSPSRALEHSVLCHRGLEWDWTFIHAKVFKGILQASVLRCPKHRETDSQVCFSNPWCASLRGTIKLQISKSPFLGSWQEAVRNLWAECWHLAHFPWASNGPHTASRLLPVGFPQLAGRPRGAGDK